MSNICIFGGTFNPIHNGHINMARKAFDNFGIDKMIFVPTGDSYLKSGVIDANIRYEMVKLALEEYGLFDISDVELKRTGPSYTYETVLYFRNLYTDDKIYILIGEDSLRYIETWKNPELIFANASVISAGRKGEENNTENANITDSVNDIINNLHNKYGADIYAFDFHDDISSSYIRKCIENNNIAEVKPFIPASVFEYINHLKLYNRECSL